MKRAFMRTVQRIGHRGAFLIFMGLLFTFYGLGLLTDPLIGVPIPFYLSNHTWAMIFMAAGFATILGSPLLRHDKWFYAIAGLMSSTWSAAWIHAWAFSDTHGAWVLAAIWAADAAITLVVSFWPEYGKKPRGIDE